MAKTIQVWTESYQPFRLGPPYIPIATEVEPTRGPVDIGKGFKAYVVKSPNGRTFIAEAITGAFVGPNLRQVRRDVKQGKTRLMKQQIAVARARVKQAERLSPERFWALYRNAL